MKIKKKTNFIIIAVVLAVTAAAFHFILTRETNAKVNHMALNLAQVGDFLFVNSSNEAYIVKKEDFSAVSDTSKCLGIVFSTETSPKDKAAGFSHGYAMALKDASSNSLYGTNNAFAPLPLPGENFPNYMDGLSDTKQMYAKEGYEAFAAAMKYNKSIHPKNTSDWFLPSAGQWCMLIDNLGEPHGSFKVEDGAASWSDKSDVVALNLNNHLKKTGSYCTLFNGSDFSYWSSTEIDAQFAYVAYFSKGDVTYIMGSNKNGGSKVRAAIAF